MSLFFWINLMIIGTGISQSQCKNWRNGFSSYISPRRLYVIIAHGYIVPALSRFISYIRTLYILRAEGKLGFRMIISRRNCLYTVINVRVWIFITENIDCGKRLFCGLTHPCIQEMSFFLHHLRSAEQKSLPFVRKNPNHSAQCAFQEITLVRLRGNVMIVNRRLKKLLQLKLRCVIL